MKNQDIEKQGVSSGSFEMNFEVFRATFFPSPSYINPQRNYVVHLQPLKNELMMRVINIIVVVV